MATTSIPGAFVKKDNSDVLEPTVNLLKGLHLLGTDDKDTDSAGAAVLEADTNAISKWVAGIIAALGGMSAVLGAVGGFWANERMDVRLALIGGVAFLVPATALALAWIITSDLKYRTAGQMKIYEARRQIAMSLLNDSFQASTPQANGAAGPLTNLNDLELDTHVHLDGGSRGPATK